MKIQKKYYLPKDVAEKLRDDAHRSGLSQSQIVEAALTMAILRDSRRKEKRR